MDLIHIITTFTAIHVKRLILELPFEEQGEVRIFRVKDMTQDDLMWHRDREDRIIYAIKPTDWKFQYDNLPPQEITSEQLFIPKNTYHRVILGTQDLHIRVIKL